jgi:hypothetical protein
MALMHVQQPVYGLAPMACIQQQEQVVMPLSMPELIHAVSTLAQDQVRPSIGVLRRRVEEISNRRVECSDIEALVEADVYGISGLRLEGAKGSLCVDINTVPPPFYVDPMDPTDPFPPMIWAALNCEVGRATISARSWSGGRYGCARSMKEEVAELQPYSLGQVQHMVQLAIKKKILGYQGGALAPYVFCNEAKKLVKSKTEMSDMSMSMSESSEEYWPATPPRQVKHKAQKAVHTPPTPPRPPLPSPDDAAKFDQLLATKLGVYQLGPCAGAACDNAEGCNYEGNCSDEEPELPLKQRMVNFEELEKEGVKIEVKGTFLNLSCGPSRRERATFPDEIVLASDRSEAQEASAVFQSNA